MTCREVIERLIEYVDGTLGEDERAMFAHHIERCASCHAYFESYLATIRLIRGS
ncbi:MAG TPA: zf-HC2 domain-containing protein [Thermoanaerobaculia bacterium]|nr:zf-HC2 domain-containing protein [Thermoanaerobaculia bacterium]